MPDDIDPEVVSLLRRMAGERRSVAEMARAILPGRHPAAVFHHFQAAFGLTFPEARFLLDWLTGGGSDDELQDVMEPRIEAHRQSWMPGEGHR